MKTDSELAAERILIIGERVNMGARGTEVERAEEIVRNVLRDYVEYGEGIPLEALVAEARDDPGALHDMLRDERTEARG